MGILIPTEPPVPPWPPDLDPDLYYCVTMQFYWPFEASCEVDKWGVQQCCMDGETLNAAFPIPGECSQYGPVCASPPPCGKMLLSVTGEFEEYMECNDSCPITFWPD